MKKRRKNPHAVALGRLGGLVRSEAKKPADRDNGRKGGMLKTRKKRIAARLNASPTARRALEEAVNAAIATIRARFGYCAIGLGCDAIRFSARALR
jgi:hypothetical protein